MSIRDELVCKLREEIDRCRLGKTLDRLEYDKQNLSLAALNTRLAEHDRRIAGVQAELDELLAGSDTPDVPPTEGAGEHRDVFISTPAPSGPEPDFAFADLLEAARDPHGTVALTNEQIRALAAHPPADLAEYRLGRMAEWSHPRYALDRRFVHLTLLRDRGETEPERWRPEDAHFSDLREVLARVDDPALVLLGVPGSGKSTLLRRLQMDHSLDELCGVTGPRLPFSSP